MYNEAKNRGFPKNIWNVRLLAIASQSKYIVIPLKVEGKVIKCKLDKTLYSFIPESGISSMVVHIKLKKIEAGTYRVILNNKIGIGLDDSNHIPQIVITK